MSGEGDAAVIEAGADVADAVTAAQTVTEKAEPTEAETRARRMGWHPKDEYDASGRDPEKWVDADTFIARGESELPVLKDRFRKLERIADKQSKEITEGTKLLRDLVAQQKTQTDNAVKAAITKLTEERKTAASVGDVDRVEALSDEIAGKREELKAPAVEHKEAKEDHVPPPEVIEWAEKNPWFQTDRKMHDLAVAEYGDLLADKSLNETQRLAKVKAEVVRRFPEKFTNTKRAEAPAVESGNGGGRRTIAKGWNDLPADVRQIADRLVSTKVVTKEQYLKDYPW